MERSNTRDSGNELINGTSDKGNTKRVPIIAVIGLATHGKSTVAERLRGLLPRTRILVIPFAKGVKDEAQRLGWNGKKDEKGRKILQYLGTEVCRNIDPDYWTHLWLRTYNKESVGYDLVVCDDLRFENELKLIQDLESYIIKIKKPMSMWSKLVRKVKLFFGRMHASEVCFNDKEDFCSKIIENYWGFEAIDKQLEDVALDLKLRDFQELDDFIAEDKEKEA